MKNVSTYIFVALMVAGSTCAVAAEQPSREYRLKAAYLHRFLHREFTEWPSGDSADPKSAVVVIGILGKDPFGDAFKPKVGQPIDGKKLVIRRFEKDVPVESFKECDLLFISSSVKTGMGIKKLLETLEKQPVLTVGETKGFIESGGMINLVEKKNTIKFEINRAAAERVGIKFHSLLLRLAIRVVESPDEDRGGKQDE